MLYENSVFGFVFIIKKSIMITPTVYEIKVVLHCDINITLYMRLVVFNVPKYILDKLVDSYIPECLKTKDLLEIKEAK